MQNQAGPVSSRNVPLTDRIYGCWLGKSIGGTLGLPAEGRTQRLAFTYYDPVPVNAPPNDDLELQLVWLHLLETRGPRLTQDDFAQAWLSHIHYMWDEYGICRWNLRRGVPAREAGTFENWFVSGMGSPIRSEIWACIAGDRAGLAADYARLDASLDHGVEGIDGEIFLSVLQNRVLHGETVAVALETALGLISPDTETFRAIELARRLHRDQVETWTAWERITAAHASDNFTHAPLNLGLIVWALLYGGGEFEPSILLAVNGGFDTDCTAATVGATLGLALGGAALPARWVEPIGEGVYLGPGILGIKAPATLRELTERTLKIADRLRADPGPIETPAPSGSVRLPDLSGTIDLLPLDGSGSVAWANGPLPESVRQAGGAAWTWTVNSEVGEGCWLVCLARHGARLYVDDALVYTCPPLRRYVPGPHRLGDFGRVEFTPKKPSYRMRVELDRKDEADAAVILTTRNFHLSAWDGRTLPHPATIDPS